MRKTTIIALFAVLLATGSLCFAADLKPFKAQVQVIATSELALEEALSYGFLSEVIAARGTPDLMQRLTLDGINNVGGKVIAENAQIMYFNPSVFAMELYEVGTITVANGDQIFQTIEGIFYLATNSGTGTTAIVGGTGRFEGVEGWTEFTIALDSDGIINVVLNGYITTVGEAKK